MSFTKVAKPTTSWVKLAGAYLLQENGAFLLLESGGKIIITGRTTSWTKIGRPT